MKKNKFKKSSFIEGTVIASLAILITKLLGIVYVIPFYSIIGEKGGALYSYAYNIYNLFLNISVAGIPLAMSKIISEYNTLGFYDAKKKAYKIGRNFVFALSLLCFFLLFCFSKHFSYLIIGNISGGNTIEDISLVIKCVSLCLLIIPFLSVMRGYLQGHKFISPSSASQIIEQIIRIAVILIGSYIAINIFHKSVSIGVGIATLGAFIGGLGAYIYLKSKINKNKHLFEKNDETSDENIKSIEIIKKIISYALPLIIVSIVTNIYSMTDLALVIRGLSYIGYSAGDAEVISSVISTWGSKICMIVTSVAVGLSVSLMPNIVSSYVKGDIKETNKRFIQSINIILVVALPLTFGISLLSGPIYTLFYGYSEYGVLILKYLSFTSFFSSLHMIMNMALQGMNKYKVVYTNTIIGFLINAGLDIPLIKLFHKFGLHPYYAPITATLIGYTVSLCIILFTLKNKMNFDYEKVIDTLKKIVFPLIIMIFPLFVLNIIIPFNESSRIMQIPIIILYTVLGGFIYLFLTYKNKILEYTFGKYYIDNIIAKIIGIFKK